MVDFYITEVARNYTPYKIIDGWKSMIWTERYNASGDFKLTLPQNHPIIPEITTQKFIVKSDSQYFMQVEDIEKDKNAGTVTFTGRTSDAILNYRVTVRQMLWPAWSITGRPIAIALQLVRYAIDRTYTYYTDMGFSNITITDQAGNPGTSANMLIPVSTTYDLVKKLCDSENVGFRLLRPTSISGNMAFNFYKGLDRSASQDTRATVLFDPELDNIEDVKSFLSTRNYIPRVWAHWTYWDKAIEDNYYYENYYNLEPYARSGTLPPDAWETRYMYFDLEGSYDPAYPGQLGGILRAQLSQKKVSVSIDGKIVPTKSSFVAGVDYFLGDMVSYRLDADTVDARVTEIIYSHDIEGEKVYPTLSFANDSAEV